MTEQDLQRNLVTRVNVGDMLTRTAWRRPDHEAVIDGPRRLSYRELNSAVNRLANALLRAGYRRGDVLALASGNSIEFLLTYYACAKTGVVCVPINLAWGPRETAYLLNHSRARGVVAESQVAGLVSAALDPLDESALTEVIVAPGTGAAWTASGSASWRGFGADGLLWFADRKKGVTKTGGENVAPIEAEKALYEAEPRGQEVVAVGLPHERWSEAITVVVSRKPGTDLSEEDVLAAARSRLPGFKVPKAVVLVDEMPRTATGTIQKNECPARSVPGLLPRVN